MKQYYETKVGKIIEEEFDSRMDIGVFAYILSKGIDNIGRITEEEIETVDGNSSVTKNFSKSLLRCAKRICLECDYIEIVEYIRLYLMCQPVVREVYLYRDEMPEESFDELLKNLRLKDKDVGDEIMLHAVVDEGCLKKGKNKQ